MGLTRRQLFQRSALVAFAPSVLVIDEALPMLDLSDLPSIPLPESFAKPGPIKRVYVHLCAGGGGDGTDGSPYRTLAEAFSKIEVEPGEELTFYCSGPGDDEPVNFFDQHFSNLKSITIQGDRNEADLRGMPTLDRIPTGSKNVFLRMRKDGSSYPAARYGGRGHVLANSGKLSASRYRGFKKQA